MKHQTEGVADRLLDCAQQEFLSKGFAAASLRNIAADAGVSTSTIYTRFGDKQGLLHAIITPVTDEMKALFIRVLDRFSEQDVLSQEKNIEDASQSGHHAIVDFIYDNIGVFRLLMLMPIEGMRSDVISTFANISAESTEQYITAIGSDALKTGRVSTQLLHTVSTAFFEGVLETVAHDMTREEAISHVDMLHRFFNTGWAGVFGTNRENGEPSNE